MGALPIGTSRRADQVVRFRWQIFVDPSAHAAVQEAAKGLGISPGEFVRRAIDNALALQQAAISGTSPSKGHHGSQAA